MDPCFSIWRLNQRRSSIASRIQYSRGGRQGYQWYQMQKFADIHHSDVVIKRCVNVFSSALSHAINMSFSSGIFSGIFKIGHVVPLLKKPRSYVNDPGNYRPITNLMTISKVFEKLVLACLRPHLHASSNFSSYQSAYRSGHSTETATLKVTDDLNSNMENKSCSLLLSLDISAAFYMMDIDTLLSRLHSDFGIAGVASTWLRSYLTDRQCYVAIGKLPIGHLDLPRRRATGKRVGTVDVFELRVAHRKNI